MLPEAVLAAKAPLPTATLLAPDTLHSKVQKPTAVLLSPLVFLHNANEPIATMPCALLLSCAAE